MFYIKENGPVTFSRAIPYRNTVVSEERDYFAATTCILKWPTPQVELNLTQIELNLAFPHHGATKTCVQLS